MRDKGSRSVNNFYQEGKSMLSSKFSLSCLLTGLTVSGLALLSNARPASACTGFWGSLDPTCDHGGILNPVHLATLDFKLCNETGGAVSFNINGQIAEPMRNGYCRTFTNYPEPGSVSFDASYADGVQSTSYDLSNEKEYYFGVNSQRSGIDLYSR